MKKDNKEEIRKLFRHWNSLEIIQHRDLTKFKPNLNSALNLYEFDELKAGMDNYATILFDDKYYWSHAWSLRDFLLRGVDRFIPLNFKKEFYIRTYPLNGNNETTDERFDFE